jgi:hypothetical protein
MATLMRVLLSFLLVLTVQAEVRIAIVIDDMGDNRVNGERALALDAPISYAFLPHTALAPRLAQMAHQKGRDVLLHAPMQSEAHLKLMGPGALTNDMDEYTLRTQLRKNFDAVPFVRGFNNHMGSVLTRDRQRMAWVMQEARSRGLFFVDSRTISGSVAREVASASQIPNIGRDVFLDHDNSVTAIRKQWQHLLSKARDKGFAVAIGHPYPNTLSVLEQELPKLTGIDVVPVSSLLGSLPSPVTAPLCTTLSVAAVNDWRSLLSFSTQLTQRCQQ